MSDKAKELSKCLRPSVSMLSIVKPRWYDFVLKLQPQWRQRTTKQQG
jgi:hypothetical protein